VAAWEMAQMSRENQKEHVASGGLDRDVVKTNDHQYIFHLVIDFSIPGFVPRQFVTEVVWKWAADKQELTVVADSVKHANFRVRKKYLRASSTAMFKYQRMADVEGMEQTKVTWTQQVDLGGAIPKWVVNGQGVAMLMYVIEHASYFSHTPH
jgi:hypothetical protein